VYVVSDEKSVVLCAPLQCFADGSWKVVAGDVIELGFVDFLYSKRDRHVLMEAFRTVMRGMSDDGIRSVTWRYLEDSSITSEFLSGWRCEKSRTTPSVRIIFKNGTEPYFQSLGRGVKAITRQAWNRIRRDGVTADFSFHSSVGIGGAMEAKDARVLLHRCHSVYLDRQASRYGHHGLMASLFFLHGSYIPLSVPGERSFVAAFTIDGDVAAYMEGYVNMSRTALEVPRVAINGKFGRYRPGKLLVQETVKWLCANSQIRAIDLCRGDEKYKIDLGGTKYGMSTVCAYTEASA